MSKEIVKPGFNFIWAIENFSHALKKSGERIESPVFKTTGCGEIELCVHLYPIGMRREEGYPGLYLVAHNSNNGLIEISAGYEISLLSDNGEILESKKVNHTCLNAMGCGFPYFISPQDLLMERRSEFLPKDTLTVCCRMLSINSKRVENASLYARTRIGVQKTSIIWSIENFGKLLPKQKASILLESISTQMDLYFPAEVLGCGEMELDISQIDISKPNLLICKISLLDVNGKTVRYKEDEHFFDASKYERWKFPQFITRNMLLSKRDRYLPRDILTLRCEFSVSIGVIESKIENYGSLLSQIVESDDTSVLDNLRISKGTDTSHNLISDLSQLYENGTHCDWSVVVEDITFPVHKSILSARSSVFRAMFDRDMIEKTTCVVNISDLNQDTVRRMLTFLYTDTVEDLQCKECIDLYIAADKYDIQYLKEKCSILLRSSVNESNLVKLLVLADKHRDQSLKKHLKCFMQGREKEIFSTEEWDTLMTDNLCLAAEIMREFCLQK